MSDGLDGVVAAETVLSHVDGAGGRLVLRGLPLEEVVRTMGFEEAAAHLWRGFVPEAGDPARLAAALGKARLAAHALMEPLLPAARRLAPVEGLRLLLAGLGDAEPTPHPVLAAAAVPVYVAALGRMAQGRAPVPPDPDLGTAADLLRMLGRAGAGRARVRALETYLVAVADHGLNASTFAARIVASTGAGVLSAVVAGLCALKGPLHGGAPGPVLDLLDAIASEDRARPVLEAELAAGRRIMGFGHRIYRGRDPRAEVLRAALLPLSSPRLALAEAVERQARALLARHRPGRRLDTNVEFYTAILLDAVGLPRSLFTPVFAAGRVVGWVAHALEQERDGRIIRPQSRYVGPSPARAA
jgi:citrate synthase